jgi:hypothetical protein
MIQTSPFMMTELERKSLLWIPERWEFFDLRPRNSPNFPNFQHGDLPISGW